MAAIKTRPDSKETQPMKTQDLKVRVAILKNLDKPKETVKTDVICYPFNAGRVNYWVKRSDSLNLDIESYFFIIKNNEINVYDENGLKIVVSF